MNQHDRWAKAPTPVLASVVGVRDPNAIEIDRGHRDCSQDSESAASQVARSWYSVTLVAVEQAHADADALLDVAYQVGAEYVAGRAPFQDHVHVRAFVFEFLFHLAHMVRDWAERARLEITSSDGLDLETRRKRGRQRIARAIRKRPKGGNVRSR